MPAGDMCKGVCKRSQRSSARLATLVCLTLGRGQSSPKWVLYSVCNAIAVLLTNFRFNTPLLTSRTLRNSLVPYRDTTLKLGCGAYMQRVHMYIEQRISLIIQKALSRFFLPSMDPWTSRFSGRVHTQCAIENSFFLWCSFEVIETRFAIVTCSFESSSVH